MRLLAQAKGQALRTNFKLMFQKFFSKRPEDYFPAWGKVMVIGGMGSGKGMSTVWYITRLMKRYPNCHLITNDPNFNPVAQGLTNKIYYVASREEYFKLMMELKNFAEHNGEYKVRNPYPRGVIAALDEINQYKSEESDEGFEMGGYLRKLNILEINQTQVYKRASLQVREQTTEVWKVLNFFGVLQIVLSYDATTIVMDKMAEASQGQASMSMKLNNIRAFWHRQDLYDTYNTYSLMDELKHISYTKQEQNEYYDFIQKTDVEDYLMWDDMKPVDNYKTRIYDECRNKTFNVYSKPLAPGTSEGVPGRAGASLT